MVTAQVGYRQLPEVYSLGGIPLGLACRIAKSRMNEESTKGREPIRHGPRLLSAFERCPEDEAREISSHLQFLLLYHVVSSQCLRHDRNESIGFWRRLIAAILRDKDVDSSLGERITAGALPASR
jgi:hypothetical protein